jgi:hypothetical protein
MVRHAMAIQNSADRTANHDRRAKQALDHVRRARRNGGRVPTVRRAAGKTDVAERTNVVERKGVRAGPLSRIVRIAPPARQRQSKPA